MSDHQTKPFNYPTSACDRAALLSRLHPSFLCGTHTFWRWKLKAAIPLSRFDLYFILIFTRGGICGAQLPETRTIQFGHNRPPAAPRAHEMTRRCVYEFIIVFRAEAPINCPCCHELRQSGSTVQRRRDDDG